MNGHDVRTTTALRSPTQFAWRCLASDPAPHGLGGPYLPDGDPATDPLCWLCGGETGGAGWPQPGTFPPTFTNHNLARVPTSRTVCGPCVAMASKATWEAYVAAHPAKGLKTGHAMSWRFYSHLFTPGAHECPTRARWRAILLSPPEPPFLAVISETGKKHLLFRGTVALSRSVFPIQFEEDRIWVHAPDFAECLSAFEALYQLGFSRESIISGHYPVGLIHKIGARAWRAAEFAFRPWRSREPSIVRLAAFCAAREGVADG